MLYCKMRKSHLSAMPQVMPNSKKIGEPLYMAYALQKRDKWQRWLYLFHLRNKTTWESLEENIIFLPPKGLKNRKRGILYLFTSSNASSRAKSKKYWRTIVHRLCSSKKSDISFTLGIKHPENQERKNHCAWPML